MNNQMTHRSCCQAKSLLAAAIGFAAFVQLSNAFAHADEPAIEPKRRGFALETHLASGWALNLPFLNGFLAGYKYERVFISVGFDVHYLRASGSQFEMVASPGTNREYLNVFMGVAETQIALTNLWSANTQLVASAGIGFGIQNQYATVTTLDGPSVSRPSDPLTLQWHVAPAFRTWVHPSLAFDFTPGLRAQHRFTPTQTKTDLVPFIRLGLFAVF